LDKFKGVITSDNKPYGLHRARDERFFIGEKIIALRKCPGRPIFTYTDFDCYVSATFYIIKTERLNQKYLTGLLNSTLIKYWLKHKGKMQGSNFQIDKEPLLNLPSFQPDEKSQEQIAKLVDKVIELYQDFRNTSTNTEKWHSLKSEIEKVEQQIDEAIYKLYGLTAEEIRTIER
jgi:adenine-specific DNA-methyltransferase